MDDTQEIRDFIEAELTQLAQAFIVQRTAALRSRKISASDALAQSLEYEVTQIAQREAVELLIAFEEHGRFIDMKRLKPPTNFGNAYINMLEEWIRARGWEQKFIAKFVKDRNLRKPPRNVLNQIAWGIAIKRGYGKTRKRKWYNKPKSAFVSELFNTIAAGLPDIVSNKITQGLKQ
jgi:hypothetical protein